MAACKQHGVVVTKSHAFDWQAVCLYFVDLLHERCLIVDAPDLDRTRDFRMLITHTCKDGLTVSVHNNLRQRMLGWDLAPLVLVLAVVDSCIGADTQHVVGTV